MGGLSPSDEALVLAKLFALPPVERTVPERVQAHEAEPPFF